MTLLPLREIQLKTAIREPCKLGIPSPTRTHFLVNDLATGKATGYALSLWVETDMLVITRDGESRWVHTSEAREVTPAKTETKNAPGK